MGTRSMIVPVPTLNDTGKVVYSTVRVNPVRRFLSASLALALFPPWLSLLEGELADWRCAVGLPAPSVHAHCVSSGVRGGCAPVESSAGIGFAACAGKHYFQVVIGTKAAF